MVLLLLCYVFNFSWWRKVRWLRAHSKIKDVNQLVTNWVCICHVCLIRLNLCKFISFGPLCHLFLFLLSWLCESVVCPKFLSNLYCCCRFRISGFTSELGLGLCHDGWFWIMYLYMKILSWFHVPSRGLLFIVGIASSWVWFHFNKVVHFVVIVANCMYFTPPLSFIWIHCLGNWC